MIETRRIEVKVTRGEEESRAEEEGQAMEGEKGKEWLVKLKQKQQRKTYPLRAIRGR